MRELVARLPLSFWFMWGSLLSVLLYNPAAPRFLLLLLLTQMCPVRNEESQLKGKKFLFFVWMCALPLAFQTSFPLLLHLAAVWTFCCLHKTSPLLWAEGGWMMRGNTGEEDSEWMRRRRGYIWLCSVTPVAMCVNDLFYISCCRGLSPSFFKDGVLLNDKLMAALSISFNCSFLCF